MSILLTAFRYVVSMFGVAVFLAALISTLLAFNVLDSRNRIVWSIADFLYRLTDPVLRPIRRVLPTMGNIDLSPWVVLLVIELLILPFIDRGLVALQFHSIQPIIY